MQVISTRQIAHNAYRILGLPSSASGQQIEQAARRMRIWPDAARIPPTLWDFPALGAVPRSRSDIDEALVRLTEPASRVAERQMWFGANCASMKSKSEQNLAEVEAELRAQGGPAADHDVALASLLAALAADPDAVPVEQWREVIRLFVQVSASADYLKWVQEVEAAGEFDKPASPDEIQGSLNALPQAAIAAFSDLAEKRIADQSLLACIKAVSVLRSCANVAPAADAGAERLLDRAEDTFVAHCNALTHELRSEARRDGPRDAAFRDHNRQLSVRVTKEYEQALAPAIGQFAAVSRADRLQRTKAAAAELLWIIGECLNLAEEFDAAETTLYKGLEHAEGTRLAANIHGAIDRVRHTRRERSRSIYGGQYSEPEGAGRAAAGAQSPRIGTTAAPSPQSTRVRRKGQHASAGSSGSRVIFILLAVVGGIIARTATQSVSTSTPDYYSPPPRQLLPPIADGAESLQAQIERARPRPADPPPIFRQTPPEPPTLNTDLGTIEKPGFGGRTQKENSEQALRDMFAQQPTPRPTPRPAPEPGPAPQGQFDVSGLTLTRPTGQASPPAGRK